jgi:putative hydrolase of the HAD superfamily
MGANGTRPILALLLDSGGVLVRPDGELIAAKADEIGITVSPLLATAAIYMADRNRDIDPSGRGSFAEHWADVVGCSRRLAIRLWMHVLAEVPPVRLWSVANPDAVQFLRELDRTAPRYVPRYVVTNSEGDAHHELCACGLRTLVDGVLDSTQLGIRKPDPRLFQMAALALRVTLDDCLYVSDTLDASSDAGMRHTLYDPFDLYGEDRGLPVEMRITRLTQLLPAFGAAPAGAIES